MVLHHLSAAVHIFLISILEFLKHQRCAVRLAGLSWSAASWWRTGRLDRATWLTATASALYHSIDISYCVLRISRCTSPITKIKGLLHISEKPQIHRSAVCEPLCYGAKTCKGNSHCWSWESPILWSVMNQISLLHAAQREEPSRVFFQDSQITLFYSVKYQ